MYYMYYCYHLTRSNTGTLSEHLKLFETIYKKKKEKKKKANCRGCDKTNVTSDLTKQWAAEMTHSGLTIAPPQAGMEASCRETCQGHE